MWPDEYQQSKADQSEFTFDSKIFVTEYNDTFLYGHRHSITSPNDHFTILEPGGPGGCNKRTMTTVDQTIEGHGMDCLVAVNGGFFNRESGECLGNLVSNSAVRNSGLKIPSFGLTSGAEYMVGYFDSLSDYDFVQLISGVVWLVRNGTNNVKAAIETEYDGVQGDFDLAGFANVTSARTAIGYDTYGRLVLVEVDGKTKERGINLFDFADFLIEHHDLVNAINLDGGGSASVYVNQTVTNYPSDLCEESHSWRCPRQVSSVARLSKESWRKVQN